jgi:ABC-type transporter Mla maintaining outer membrane lipid asymmetry ATPase subunit MlaF
MELVFKHVNVEVDKKLILNNLSGLASPGELLAIMGPSGETHTVLLHVHFANFDSS